MKLTRKQDQVNMDVRQGTGFDAVGRTLDRRTFLRRSGLAVGGAALAGSLPLTLVRKVRAAQEYGPPEQGVETEIRRSICTHCSVGCGVIAELQNGVWVGQEPDFDSPINLGAHCAKGASVREHGTGDRRVKYPMQLIDGKWKRINWVPIRCSFAVPRKPVTKGPTCSASSRRSGAAITWTIRPASAIRPRSPASPTPGAMAR
jgi:formate dehydrogenase major subunit